MPKDEWRTTREVVRVERTVGGGYNVRDTRGYIHTAASLLDYSLAVGTHRTVEVEVRVREVEELLDWPCQQLHGGRPPYIYQGVNEYGHCRHPECHPRNDDREPEPTKPEGEE